MTGFLTRDRIVQVSLPAGEPHEGPTSPTPNPMSGNGMDLGRLPFPASLANRPPPFLDSVDIVHLLESDSDNVRYHTLLQLVLRAGQSLLHLNFQSPIPSDFVIGTMLSRSAQTSAAFGTSTPLTLTGTFQHRFVPLRKWSCNVAGIDPGKRGWLPILPS